MSDDVMNFLVSSGGGTIDELLVRLPTNPDVTVDRLKKLEDEGYIKVTGPGNILKLENVVDNALKAEDFAKLNRSNQVGRIVSELIGTSSDLLSTFVSPTIKGSLSFDR